MTVSDQNPRIQYVGNSATRRFAFGFQVMKDSDLIVNVDGTTYTLTSHYIVSGAGDPTGGYVTLNTGLQVPNNKVITIIRNGDLERSVNYTNNGALRAETLNNEQDKIWRKIQELQYAHDRTLRYPFYTTTSAQPLVTPGSATGYPLVRRTDGSFGISSTSLESVAATAGDQAVSAIIQSITAGPGIEIDKFVDHITITATEQSLAGLFDTNVTSASANQVLTFDGAYWVPRNAPSGNAANPEVPLYTLTNLGGTAIAADVSDNEDFKFKGIVGGGIISVSAGVGTVTISAASTGLAASQITGAGIINVRTSGTQVIVSAASTGGGANVSALSQLSNDIGLVSAAQVVGGGIISVRTSGSGTNSQIIISAAATGGTNVSALSQLSNDIGLVSAAQVVGRGAIEIRTSGSGTTSQLIFSAAATNLDYYIDDGSPVSASDYNDFDLYQDATTGDLYQILSGAWVYRANVRGPEGPKGDKGDQGPAGPAGTTPDGALVYAAAPNAMVTSADFSLDGYYAWSSANHNFTLQTSLRPGVLFSDVTVAGTVITMTSSDFNRPKAYKVFASCEFVLPGGVNKVNNEMKDVQIYFGTPGASITMTCISAAQVRVAKTIDANGGQSFTSFTKTITSSDRYIYSVLRTLNNVYEWY